jgi:Fe-S oxidoreductase
MSFANLMKSAPRYLTLRYGSLNSYVWESLFPKKDINKRLFKIKDEEIKKTEIGVMKSIVDEATLLVFIFVTRKVFIEGSNTAKEAVDILKELGVNEFYLGKAKFAERNENVMMGERLSERLLLSLNPEMRALVLDSNYVYQILDRYRKLTRKSL